MSIAHVSALPVHRPPSLHLDPTRRRDSSTSPSSPFPLSSSVFESDSDFRSQSSASLLGSSPHSSDLPHSALLSIAESSTPKKRTASQPATALDTPLRQARHSLYSTSTMSLPTSSPNKPDHNPLEEPTIVIPDLRSSTSSLHMQLGDFTTSTLSLETASAAIMIVRDFAYDESDDRHYGRGLERQGQPEPQPPSPKREPFQSNWGFGQAVEQESYSNHGPYPAYDEPEQDMSESIFVPGYYRCLYDFVPEGPAEMAMSTGELYHIVSRCGPVGWVIAVNDDGTTGIVPEGYVTLERREDDFEDERSLPEEDIKLDDELETPTASETPTSSNESMDDDAPPTPHAGLELSRSMTPPAQEGEKMQLPAAALEHGEPEPDSSNSTPHPTRPLSGHAADLPTMTPKEE